MSDLVKEVFDDLIAQMDEPPTWDQLRSAQSTRARMRPRLRGVWVALAAFVGVLLVGGLTWTMVSNPPPVANKPLTATNWDLLAYLPTTDGAGKVASQIESIPGVVEARYFPADDVEIASILMRLENPTNAEAVASRIKRDVEEVYSITYSEAIAETEGDAYFEFATAEATVVEQDPLILQPSQGPAPRFDTSVLGAEVALHAAESASDIPAGFLSQVRSPSMGTDPLDPDRPVIHVGYLEEIGSDLLVYGTRSNGYCVWVSDGTGSGSTCANFNLYAHGVVLTGTGYPVGHAAVRVPEATSVVTLQVDSGEIQWQRPSAGWALFPLRVTESTHLTTTAYDADGTLIGKWEQSG
jgi:hypothetical protein